LHHRQCFLISEFALDAPAKSTQQVIYYEKVTKQFFHSMTYIITLQLHSRRKQFQGRANIGAFELGHNHINQEVLELYFTMFYNLSKDHTTSIALNKTSHMYYVVTLPANINWKNFSKRRNY